MGLVLRKYLLLFLMCCFFSFGAQLHWAVAATYVCSANTRHPASCSCSGQCVSPLRYEPPRPGIRHATQAPRSAAPTAMHHRSSSALKILIRLPTPLSSIIYNQSSIISHQSSKKGAHQKGELPIISLQAGKYLH